METFSALNDISCVYFIQHLPNFKGQMEGQRNKNLGSASSMCFVINWSQSKYWVSRYDLLSLGGFICIQKLVNFQFIYLIFCKGQKDHQIHSENSLTDRCRHQILFQRSINKYQMVPNSHSDTNSALIVLVEKLAKSEYQKF